MPRTGYLYKRGDTWWGRVRIAGGEHRRSLRTSDKKEARQNLQGWLKALRKAAAGNPDCPTLKAATVRWAREVLPQAVKPAVGSRYLTSIRQIVDTLGDKPVDVITASTIAEYASRRSRIASNATIRRDLTALSRLLASCVAWGYRSDNPARVYDRSLLRERRAPIQPPEPRDVATVIAGAPSAMAKVLYLLDQTGMRANDAVMLEAQEVDLARQQIRLTRTKTNRPRTIDFLTPGGDAGAALTDLPQSGPLFPSGTGEAYRNFPTFAAKVIANVAAREKKAGRPFRKFRVHDLRHGFAIRALREGMDIYSLSRHLGHTSVRTTEIYLGYLTGEEQHEARYGAQNRAQDKLTKRQKVARNVDELET